MTYLHWTWSRRGHWGDTSPPAHLFIHWSTCPFINQDLSICVRWFFSQHWSLVKHTHTKMLQKPSVRPSREVWAAKCGTLTPQDPVILWLLHVLDLYPSACRMSVVYYWVGQKVCLSFSVTSFPKWTFWPTQSMALQRSIRKNPLNFRKLMNFCLRKLWHFDSICLI